MRLMLGDCLELMKEIPDGSVDLVLTDPPYGTIGKTDGSISWMNSGHRNKWDECLPVDVMFSECSRVLRPNGKCVLFAQEPITSRFVTEAIPSLPFSYRAVWVKNVHANALGCNHAMVGRFEDVCIFSKDSGFSFHDFKKDHPLREYFKKEFKESGIGAKECREILGNGMYSHYCTDGVQFVIPSEENYKKLQSTGNFKMEYALIADIDARWKREKKSERDEYYSLMNDRYPSTFNLWQGGKSKSNVLEYPKDRDHYHPTQKPVALLDDLIKTFSNPGDTVLDFTMGSGSTGVACVNTGRDFIGIELDEGYFDIARRRIEEARRERDALLELSDECGGASTAYEGDVHELTSRQFANVARRIREALGVVDGQEP